MGKKFERELKVRLSTGRLLTIKRSKWKTFLFWLERRRGKNERMESWKPRPDKRV
jgi:hypothetical protein